MLWGHIHHGCNRKIVHLDPVRMRRKRVRDLCQVFRAHFLCIQVRALLYKFKLFKDGFTNSASQTFLIGSKIGLQNNNWNYQTDSGEEFLGYFVSVLWNISPTFEMLVRFMRKING